MPSRAPIFPRISDYAGHFAQQSPYAEAMVFGERRWTWNDFAADIDVWARAMLAAGVRKGDRVVCLSTSRPEFWISLLASARIGAIWVGLNPRHTLGEMSHVMADSSPVLMIALDRHRERDLLPEIRALSQNHGSLRKVVCFGSAEDTEFESLDVFVTGASAVSNDAFVNAVDAVGPRDPAVIVYTSGTTGVPKGALLSHWGLSYCSHFQNRTWGSQKGQIRIINFFPINHLAAVCDVSCFALIAGGVLVWMEQFDPAAVIDSIETERITVLGGVPTMHQMIFTEPDIEKRDLSSLETIAIGGAGAPLSLIKRLRAHAPLVSTGYGSTETIGHMTFTPPSATDEQISSSIGLPVREYSLRIADESGTSVWPGEEGEVQVRGDFTFLGYHNRPDATAEAFTADGWYRTGDVGVALPDGMWRLVGRMKEMFKSGGYNIYPREIEICLEAHPLVEMAAVVNVPDPLYQEVGHAFVQTSKGSELDDAVLRDHCRKHLANYKIPKRITVVEKLPILPVGKIDKQALKSDIARENPPQAVQHSGQAQ